MLNCVISNSCRYGSVKALLLIMLLVVSLCVGIYVGVRNIDQGRFSNPNEQLKAQRRQATPEFSQRSVKDTSEPIRRTRPTIEAELQTNIASERQRGEAKSKGEQAASSTFSEGHHRSIDVLKAHLPSAIREMLDGVEVHKPLWQLELSRLPVNEGLIALTFDAHYTDEFVPQILGVLKRYNVRVTFFVTGHWADKFPESLKMIASHGHEIGNHTYSHPRLTKLSDEAIVGEVKRAEESILKAVGDKAPLTPYVRPPYGDRDERVAKVLLSSGYIPVYWAVDGLDWKKDASENAVVERVVMKSTPGDIVLLHATSKVTSNSLPSIIDGLLQKGLQPCSVTELVMHCEVK